MTVWRYYEVSKGKDLDYNNIKVEPAITFLHCKFTKIDQIYNTQGKKKKPRVHCSLCTLHFYSEPSCNESFKGIECFEPHMLAGIQSNVIEKTQMDAARNLLLAK